MKTTITWQKGQHLDTGTDGNTLIMISYAAGDCRQFYLNWTREDAEAHFSTYMAARSPIECDMEGWDALAVELPFGSEGTAWMGTDAALGQLNKLFQDALASGDMDAFDKAFNKT